MTFSGSQVGHLQAQTSQLSILEVRTSFCSADCRDVLLPLVTDQLSGQLDDHSIKPDYEACAQLLSTVLDNLDRRDVVSRNPES